MGKRLQLQSELERLLGSRNVYYQPPSQSQMVYPCIKYELSDEKTGYSNNRKYLFRKKYQLTIIDKNPDSNIPNIISEMSLCKFDRHYTADGLNHFVYNIYY